MYYINACFAFFGWSWNPESSHSQLCTHLSSSTVPSESFTNRTVPLTGKHVARRTQPHVSGWRNFFFLQDASMVNAVKTCCKFLFGKPAWFKEMSCHALWVKMVGQFKFRTPESKTTRMPVIPQCRELSLSWPIFKCFSVLETVQIAGI